MDKLKTGVAGLDEMLGGGVPKGHSIALLGNYGTGKTTFSLQFAHAGLAEGEKVIFISLEEDEESMVASAANYGWNLKPYLEQQKLMLVRLEPHEAKQTIGRVQSELPRAIADFGAQRVVMDSISLLNMLYADEKEVRNQAYMLVDMVRKAGATMLVTAEVRADNNRVSRRGEIEYVVDGVILLQASESPNAQEIQLRISILKMRRCAHSRAVRPYQLGEGGIKVLADTMVY